MPRLRLVLILLGLSFFGSACGDDPSDTEEPPTDTNPPPGELPEEVEYSEHIQQIIRFIDAECTHAFRCPSNNSLSYNTIDECITERLAGINLYNRQILDSEKMRIREETLVAYEQLLDSTCGVPATSQLHDAILITLIGGTLNDGDICQNHSDCWGSSQCTTDPNTPGIATCTPAPVALGGGCSNISDCANAGNERIFCAIKPGNETGSCAPWEYPAPKNINETCGMDANGYAQLCGKGLWCHNGTCLKPLQTGALCGGTGSYGCAAGNFCRSTFVNNLGVCVKPSFLDEGQDCSRVTTHYAFCNFDDGFFCDPDTQQCAPYDFQCVIDEDCTDGLVRCTSDLACVGPAQIGEPCASDRHCASNNCVSVPDAGMVCQAP